MIGRKILLAATCILAAVPGLARAQDLLANGGLELESGDPGGSLSVPPGWVMDEGPSVPRFPGPYEFDYNEGGVPAVPCPPGGYCKAVDAADYTVWRDNLGKTLAGDGYQLPNEGTLNGNPITPGIVSNADYTNWKANFGLPYSLSMAEPTNFPHTVLDGEWNMWFQPYYGTFAELPEALDNFAHLYQDVAGTPGLTYTMKGSAAFESYFAGARANLNQEGTDASIPDDGPPSSTKALFALEFLDSGGTVLPGSVEIDLRNAGQVITPPGSSFVTYMEHTLSGVAPAGTANVRVRASMLDGVLNPGVDPQSFFVDAFELTSSGGAASVVPEPASLGLCMLATIVASLWRRRAR